MPRALRTAVLLCLLAVAVAFVAVPALAAGRHGITPTAPKARSTVATGSTPTFRGRVRGAGPVWVLVCASPKRNAKGLICSKDMIEPARRRSGGRFAVRARFFDYPGFWLNTPGTYYWQAHRIHCDNGTSDCVQEGPVVKFRVG